MSRNEMLEPGMTGVSGCLTVRVGRFALALLMVFAVVFGAKTASAQAQNTGSVYGTVTDPTGAVVPGAQVVAAEPSLGVNRTVTTSKSGEFVLPALPVGVYVVTVTGSGFQTYVADSVQVDADNSTRVAVKMVVGNQTDTVNVEADGSAVDTRSAQLATVIDNKLVEDLPIDGRNVVALAGLLPGVTDLNAPTSNTNDKTGSTYSVSGSRSTQNLQLFDGLMWNNLFLNTGIQFPPPNGLQEISVLLNNFKAQYGRNAGSVFNVVTKRGTNTIHGAVWEYLQNQMFNASDYITQRNPKDNLNQFGFTVGAPIVKDKIFVQVTFQDIIQHLQNIGVTPTQSAQERGFADVKSATTLGAAYNNPCKVKTYSVSTCADFSDIATQQSVNGPSTGTTANVFKFENPALYQSTSGLQAGPTQGMAMILSAYNQEHGTALTDYTQLPCYNDLITAGNFQKTLTSSSSAQLYLPYGQVPTSCLNPVITRILQQYVGVPNVLSANGQLNNISVAPLPRNEKNFTARGDWIINSRHSVDMRYNMIVSDDRLATGVNSASLGVSTYAPDNDHALSNFGNIGETWVITPNLLNVARAGYKRYSFTSPPVDLSTLNTFGGNLMEPSIFGTPTLPVLNASNQYSLGNTSQANSAVTNENIELLDQLSYTRGKHTFQTGVNYLHLQYLNRSDYPGRLSFSSTFTGISYADEALGLVNSIQANSPLVQGGIQNDLFAYVQDDWRVSQKLTLNLGARYELPFQWYQPTGYSSTFIAGHQSTVFPGAIGGLAFPGDPGVRRSLVPTDFNGIVPRLGFAYDVFGTGTFAIRGGFGMFFDAINANVIGVGEPFYFQVFKQLPLGGASNPLAGYGANGSTLVIPGGYNKANPQFQAPYTLFYPDRNFRTPYYEAFNFGFQARVTRTGNLDVNYVGKLGRKQTIAVDQNPAIYDCSGGYYQANPSVYCPIPGQGLAASANTRLSAATSNQSIQSRLRYTPFNYGGNGLVDYESAATSNYNALQAMYTQRGGKRLTMTVSYTYSKSIDLQTGAQQLPGPQNVIPNVFNIATERGLSDNNAKHVLNMGWSLTLPRVTTGNSVVRAVLNNWVYAGVFQARTGRPFNLTTNSTSVYDEPNERPALVAGANPNLPSSRHRTAKLKEYFNVDAFTYPNLTLSNSIPRNFLVGPGYLNTQMNISRYFPLDNIRAGMKLQLRAEAFNVFNTPNLQNPRAQFSCSSTSLGPNSGTTSSTYQGDGSGNNNGSCNAALNTYANMSGASYSNTTFGVIQSTYGTNGNTSTNGRKMQFAATIYF